MVLRECLGQVWAPLKLCQSHSLSTKYFNITELANSNEKTKFSSFFFTREETQLGGTSTLVTHPKITYFFFFWSPLSSSCMLQINHSLMLLKQMDENAEPHYFTSFISRLFVCFFHLYWSSVLGWWTQFCHLPKFMPGITVLGWFLFVCWGISEKQVMYSKHTKSLL